MGARSGFTVSLDNLPASAMPAAAVSANMVEWCIYTSVICFKAIQHDCFRFDLY